MFSVFPSPASHQVTTLTRACRLPEPARGLCVWRLAILLTEGGLKRKRVVHLPLERIQNEAVTSGRISLMDKNALSVEYRTCRNVYASSTNQTLKRFTGAPGTRRLGHPRRITLRTGEPPDAAR